MIVTYKVGAFVVNIVFVFLELKVVKDLLTYSSHDGPHRVVVAWLASAKMPAV